MYSRRHLPMFRVQHPNFRPEDQRSGRRHLGAPQMLTHHRLKEVVAMYVHAEGGVKLLRGQGSNIVQERRCRFGGRMDMRS